MNEYIKKITDWIKANKLPAIMLGVVLVVLLFGRQVKRLIFGKRRIRHRKSYLKVKSGGRRRKLPRSVGVRASGRGYPKAGGGYIPFKRNKDGTIKKAWQVSGTVAAKNRMSRLRRARA